MKPKHNKKLEKVYANYSFMTDKINDQYYREPRYKQLTHLFYESLYVGSSRSYAESVKRYNSVTKYLEALTTNDFVMLCDMEEMGLLDDLVMTIKEIVRTKV